MEPSLKLVKKSFDIIKKMMISTEILLQVKRYNTMTYVFSNDCEVSLSQSKHWEILQTQSYLWPLWDYSRVEIDAFLKGEKHFKTIHWLKIRWVIENVLYVGFHAQITLWQAKYFILWYPPYRDNVEISMILIGLFVWFKSAHGFYWDSSLFQTFDDKSTRFQKIQAFRNYPELDGHRVLKINCKILEGVHWYRLVLSE